MSDTIDTIDRLADQPEGLRFVTLTGPLVHAGGTHWPLWILRAQSPSFGRKYAFDANRKPSGTTADHAHPMRVLATDPPGREGADWMQPRQLDMHLLVGADDNFRYEEKPDGEVFRDGVTFGWGAKLHLTAKADQGTILRTRPEGPEPASDAAPFVRVTVEPLPAGLRASATEAEMNWMARSPHQRQIAVPPLRLVSGAVGLRAKIVDRFYLAWLRKLGIIEDPKAPPALRWSFWLVHDGIEFQARLPFPGQGAGLTGRVRLHPDAEAPGQFRLTLIEPDDEAAWRSAWNRIVPGAAGAGEGLLGMNFAPRRQGALPPFYWKVKLDDKGPKELEGVATKAVWVPSDQCTVSLVSPPRSGRIDSEATLRLPPLLIEEQGTGLIRFSAPTPPPAPNAPAPAPDTGTTCLCLCKPDAFSVEVTGRGAQGQSTPAVELDIDSERLAVALRAVHDLPEPPAVNLRREAGLGFGAAYARPLLSAFVPLENGWLQLPVPNLGPIDIGNDKLLAAREAAPPESVLSGFVRLIHDGLGDAVQSGHEWKTNPARTLNSPWSLTVEAAGKVDLEVLVKPADAGGSLVEASVTLGSAILSARGLLWVSSDRPDAQEVLARLGAGPNAYLDTLMQTAPPGDAWPAPLQAVISSLKAEVQLKDQAKDTPKVRAARLHWTALDIRFRTNAARWIEEVLRPREARDALGASRALIEGAYSPNFDVPRAAAQLRFVRAERAAFGRELRAAGGHRARLAQPLLDLARIGTIAQSIRKASAAIDTATQNAGAADIELDHAQRHLDAAQAALPAATPPNQRPWFPVAWLRHERIALAATMPMTRTGSGSPRPLESRDLFPYALRSSDTGTTPDKLPERITLAALVRLDGTPLLGLAMDAAGNAQFHLEPVGAWPRLPGATPPERGIALALVGVPGAELWPGATAAAPGVRDYQGAYRFDLPLLDEAFATAPLPPPSTPGEDARREPASVPTALDWPALAAWWGEQERKHQNARVAHSYAFGPRAVDTLHQNAGIVSLIDGLTWTADVRLDTAGDDIAAPPYGRIAIGPFEGAGNRALLGYTARFERKDSSLAPAAPTAAIGATFPVLGFSPGTFADGGLQLDNRQAGAGDMAHVGDLLARPVRIKGKQGLRLVSLREAQRVAIGHEAFDFWFKDVLFDAAGALLPITETAFNVFDDPERLARQGCEWRFGPADPLALDAVLTTGRSEIPFYGLRLEPLRLTALAVGHDGLESATLLCRLTMNPRSDGVNLVALEIGKGGDGKAGAFEATLAQVANAGPLEFGFTVDAGGQLPARRVRVRAQPPSKPRDALLEGLSMEIELAGVMVALGAPAIMQAKASSGAARVTITQPTRLAKASVHSLVIDDTTIKVGYLLRRCDAGRLLYRDLRLKWSWTPRLQMFAAGARRTGPAIDWPLAPKSSLTVLGIATAAATSSLSEADGALVITLTGAEVKAGDKVLAMLDGAALVRPASVVNQPGIATLVAGHCELSVIQWPGATLSGKAPAWPLDDGVSITEGRVDLAITSENGGVWSAHASVTAHIAVAASDINWPQLDWAAAASAIPLPTAKTTENSGRVRIKPATGGGAATHSVDWVLSGHRLGLALLADVCAPDGKRVWVTPAAAWHTLAGQGKQISWASVDPLVIGRRKAVVPPPASGDMTTLAPRYAYAISKGEWDDQPEAGMAGSGLGEYGTVLRGALGKQFRTLYHAASPDNRFMFASGFTGLVGDGRSPVALLRLPVLAGSGYRYGQKLETKGAELAWPDGPAARALAWTRPTGPAPADAGLDALAAALLAGSLHGAGGRPDLASLAAAMPVEQYLGEAIDMAPKPPAEALAGTPFFLAAAVGINRLLRTSPGGASQALSLLSGAYTQAGKTVQLAASLLLPPAAPRVVKRPAESTLYVIGDNLRTLDWTARSGGARGASLPYLRALAANLDADPRGILLVERAARSTYRVGTLASLALDAPHARAPGNAFSDGRRGPPATPGEHTLGWLAAPHEGAAQPIRDARLGADGAISGSGVAGIARTLALPAHAGASFAVDPKASAGTAIAVREDAGVAGMVWVSQTQVPVYLPLKISGLRGMPVTWLQPAPPCVRLPGADDVRSAAGALAEPVAPAPIRVQGFLPAQAAHASIGERAGIMTVRRTRLLATLGSAARLGIDAFDAAHPSFGAPAQAGSSWARSLRTPRPGPLPPNLGDPRRDRRVQASQVRPLDPASALIGPADIVEGTAGAFGQDRFDGWSIVVSASPESAGVMAERWDGVLRAVCQVEVRKNIDTGFTLAIEPFRFVACALFGAADKMSAGLKIGDLTLLFRWASLQPSGTWSATRQVRPPAAQGTAAARGWCTLAAEVEVMFDLRAVPMGQRGSAWQPFAAALGRGAAPVPPVEFQWTVIPRSNAAQPPSLDSAWRLNTDPARGVTEGSLERPALTLRMPLYPVRQDRGALPLTTATMLFGDPAYDRDLAGLSARAVQPLKAQAGNALDARGDLRFVLHADRARVNRKGTVTFMLDIAYEKRLDDLAQASAENRTGHRLAAVPGGDLCGEAFPAAALGLQLIPASGPIRDLAVRGDLPAASLRYTLATIYELPLAALTETDGKPAALYPGDVLRLSASLQVLGVPAQVTARLWNAASGEPQDVTVATEGARCWLNLTLTEEPVIEPPPALYLALQRSVNQAGKSRLSVPLHAQSPLPRRTDMLDAARGLRNGLVQRHANFVWTLGSSAAGLAAHSLAPVKSDRNGQVYLPETVEEFLTPNRPGEAAGAQ